MDCLSCAVPLSSDARFCAACGTPVPQASGELSDPLRELLKVALGRQYEIVRLLGRGGMGAVYLAREQSLDREVAIKVLPPQQHTTADMRERFRREARTAARLSHPNIVPLYTFGEVDGTLYFVMGFVKGESLADRLHREHRLPVEAARRILIDIAQALEYAHSLGIVHRDIKPDNVLLEAGSGRAILTDFGVAKPLGAGETLTMEGSLLGTPHYMSPEQASGRSDIDHRSDLYSLGVMGYAMLSGRLPFEGKTTQELLVQHMTVDAPPLHVLAPGVAPELSIALTRCLAKDPAHRWFSAADFRARLDPPGEDDLPQDVSDLRELVSGLVIIPILLMYACLWFLFRGGDNDWIWIGSAIGGLFLVGPIVGILFKWRSLRMAGFDHARITREAFRQPKKWIGWYPRSLRVKGDVWDRLPRRLRYARTLLSSFIVMTFFLVVPFWIALMANINKPESQRSQFPKWAILLVGLAIVPLLAGLYFQGRWRRSLRGDGSLDRDIEAKLVTLSTLPSPFWSKPSVQRFLEPDTPREAIGTNTSSPSELVQEIRSLAARLNPTARDLGVMAMAAAERVNESIRALDDEIGTLVQTNDPGERARLTMRLAAVGGGEAATRLEIRSMLQRQLEVVDTLDARLSAATKQRAERTELLRALRMHVVALTAAQATTPATDTIDAVRALCERIATNVATESESTLIQGPH